MPMEDQQGSDAMALVVFMASRWSAENLDSLTTTMTSC